MKSKQNLQIDPTRITKPIPNINDQLHEIIKVGGIHPKASLKEAKEDRRSFNKHWDSTEEDAEALPDCLKKLVEVCKEIIEDPIGYRVYYGSYMRKAMTRFPPPTEDTISRFLFNIGNTDKYVFDGNVPALTKLPSLGEMIKRKTGCDLPEKDIMMPENHMIQLGSATLTNYIIYVSPDVKIERPATVNPFNMQKTKVGHTLRVARYHRICVIIDLLGEEETVVKAAKQAEDMVDRISSMDIQEIAKTINPNNTPEEDKEEKLSKREQAELRKTMKNVKAAKQ